MVQVGDITRQDASAQLPKPIVGQFTRDMAGANGNVAYTGIGFTPSLLYFSYATNSDVLFGDGFTDGTTEVFQKNNRAGTLNDRSISTAAVITLTEVASPFDISTATLVSLDSDGFTLDWQNSGGTPVGTITVNFIAFK